MEKWTASWKGAENIDLVGFVPDNFDGQNFNPSDTTNMGQAYVPKILSLIDSWEQNAPNPKRTYAIYAGWPVLNGYGGSNDDPETVSAAQYSNWRSKGLGSYQDWMELLVKQLKDSRPNLDIKLHNINKALLMCFENTLVKNIKPGVLFEDLAPHGRSSWYFLASVAEYIELFDEKPPSNFSFKTEWAVDSAIVNNYNSLVDYIWTVLKGSSASTHAANLKNQPFFYPNPAHSIIKIHTTESEFEVTLRNTFGKRLMQIKNTSEFKVELPPGAYTIELKSSNQTRQEILILN